MYYKDSSHDRQLEIDRCLKFNIENKLIEKIFVFTEIKYDISHPKIRQEVINKRLTYQYAFDFSNKNLDGNICILANSDVYFDYSLNKINTTDFTNKFYAITRHNVQNDSSIKFTDNTDCQDVWIWKSPIKNFPANFELRQPGCDNRIAWESKNAGLNVLNPCKIIKCYHLHLINKYNYIQNKSQIPGPYEWVEFGDQL